MPVDIGPQVDRSLIVDGQPIDAADVRDPLDDLVQVINNILNGVEMFDRVAFTAAGSVLNISSDAVTITKGYHVLNPQTGSTDDLSTINGGGTTRHLLLLQADTGDTITIKHAVGNIFLNGAADFVLSGDKALLLFYDGTNWCDVGAGGGSGTGVNFGTSTELTIATGSVTRSGSHHRIDTEADAATDDLDTIAANGATDGFALVITAEHTDRTVVVKHNTGNIVLNGGIDFSLDNTEKAVLLIWRNATARWIGIGVPISGGGGGTVTSVGLSTDAPFLTVSGSPVTTSGTLSINRTTGLTQNQVVATPDGASGVVGLRALVNNDLPTVSIARGGTGQTTQTTAFNALAPTTTEGDLIVRGTSNNVRLPIGSNGQVLRVNTGVAGQVEWGAAAGGSFVELVARTELGSPASTIDISSIPADYDQLLLIVELRSDRAASTDDDVHLRFNADATAANYYSLTMRFNNSIWSNTTFLGATATGIRIRQGATAANSDSGLRAFIQVWIGSYAVTGSPRNVSYQGFSPADNVATLLSWLQGGGTWLNTANAINQITLLPVNGTNFATGSAYALYGIGA